TMRRAIMANRRKPTAAKGEAMKTAYSYLRFSDRKQAKGDSQRRQVEWSEQVAAREGWMLDIELTLRDLGVSAFRGKNAAGGALGQFLRAVEEERVPPGSVLLVESLDRLTRQQAQRACSLFLDILNAGIEIRTREPDRHYKPGATMWELIEAF